LGLILVTITHSKQRRSAMKEAELTNKIGSAELPRRTFLRIAVLGGGATLLASMLPAAIANAAGNAEALLLSCMDFRLMDDIERYMTGRGLRNKYDHIVLAGAALGAVTDKYPAWNKTFWDHIGLAVDLHHIHKVIVMDHRDCGAYTVILKEDFAKNPAKEKTIHSEKLKELNKRIKKQRPNLEVELLLMSLDGQVESIA
jgi:carbonic anhydrase